MPLPPEFIAAFARTVRDSAEGLLMNSDEDASGVRAPACSRAPYNDRHYVTRLQ